MTTFEIASLVLYSFILGPALFILLGLVLENGMAVGQVPGWLAPILWGIIIVAGGPAIWALAVILFLVHLFRRRC